MTTPVKGRLIYVPEGDGALLEIPTEIMTALGWTVGDALDIKLTRGKQIKLRKKKAPKKLRAKQRKARK